jgi:hypothetical protein
MQSIWPALIAFELNQGYILRAYSHVDSIPPMMAIHGGASRRERGFSKHYKVMCPFRENHGQKPGCISPVKATMLK